jgi:hypothetical protein
MAVKVSIFPCVVVITAHPTGLAAAGSPVGPISDHCRFLFVSHPCLVGYCGLGSRLGVRPCHCDRSGSCNVRFPAVPHMKFGFNPRIALDITEGHEAGGAPQVASFYTTL